MDFEIKRKERKALNFSLCSLTHRNARTIKLVSLRVRRIRSPFFALRQNLIGRYNLRAEKHHNILKYSVVNSPHGKLNRILACIADS